MYFPLYRMKNNRKKPLYCRLSDSFLIRYRNILRNYKQNIRSRKIFKTRNKMTVTTLFI